jgi:4-amino-4-deoxy-L-arabinose transferase-like glycosyltransferase
LSGKDGAGEMLILSLAGAIIVLALAWLGASDYGGAQLADRLIVGVSLLTGFLLGISLAVKPGWMRRLRRDAVHSADVSPSQSPGRVRHGHHPDCEHFGPHTVRVGGKVLCAGCTGLALGSVASIAMVSLYVPLQMSVPPPISIILVAIGTALVAASLADSELFQARGGERLLSNLVMPFGFFLVAAGLLEATGNAAYGMTGVLISFLWLDTRIRLSRRRHIRICRSCGEACKSYLA